MCLVCCAVFRPFGKTEQQQLQSTDPQSEQPLVHEKDQENPEEQENQNKVQG